jgi:hypothetical protein
LRNLIFFLLPAPCALFPADRSLKTVRVLRDLFVAFVISKRSSLPFARWCWEIFLLAALAAPCSLPVRRSEAGCHASVVDRKILKPCQIMPFRAIMLIGPIRGCQRGALLSRRTTCSSNSARIALIASLVLIGPELFQPLNIATFSFSLN